MANLNRVILIGNLTKDPEMRYTTSGAAVCNLRMAVNRKWKSKDGKEQEEVLFVTVVVWNKVAESCAEYLKKGSSLMVEGRLQSKTWEKEDKSKVTTIDVVAENVQFLGGKTDVRDDVPSEEPKATVPYADDPPF